jgi:hypothetical protein
LPPTMDSKFSSSFFTLCLLEVFFFIGCVTSAPDGSSPRGYGRVLVVDHRLKISSFSSSSLLVEFFLKIINLSGARPALPMGVAPWVYVRVLVAGHRLKLYYSKKFNSCWRTWWFCRLL